MNADAHLPVWVNHVPGAQVFDTRGNLKLQIKHYVDQGVVRVVAGPTDCRLCINVQRPYFRPGRMIEATHLQAQVSA